MVWILLITLGVLAEFFGKRDPAMTVAFFPLIPLAAMAIGGMLSKASKDRAEGRAAEANYGLNRDQLLSQLYQAQQEAALAAAQGQERGAMDRAALDLQRRNFAMNGPDTRLSQAIRGSLTANARDARATHPRANVVHFEGGPRPSMLNADARKLGELLARQALIAQLAGDKFDAVPETQFPVLDPGQSFRGNQGILSQPPKPSGLDKFLNIAGSIGTGIGGIGALQGGGIGNGSTPPINQTPTTFLDPKLLGGGSPSPYAFNPQLLDPTKPQPSFLNPNLIGGS